MQKGFQDGASKTDAVWIYTKKQLPYKANPKKHGAERKFYEDSFGSTADEAITRFESSIAPIVSRMRRGEFLPEDVARIPQLIAHLEIRSKFLREETLGIMNVSIDQFVDSLSTPKSQKKLILKQLAKNDSILMDKLKELAVTPEMEGAVKEYLLKYLDGHDWSADSSIDEGLTLLREMIGQNGNRIALEAHNKAISEVDAAPEGRSSSYEGLKFRLQTISNDEMILPDNCVAFVMSTKISPLFQKGDSIQAVLLPISSSRLIVGSPKGDFQRETQVVNSILASSAYASFVASSRNSKLEKLQKKIGGNAILLTNEAARAIARRAINEF